MKKIAFITMALILVFDQITKHLALMNFANGPMEITPFFNFVLVWNRGISFGLFSDSPQTGPLILVILSLIIITALFFWLKKTTHKPLIIAISAVIGGALGNVIDRIHYGAVIDFLDFHAWGWHYPAFNIADTAIVLGIAFILFDSLFLEQKRIESQNNEKN